MVKIDDLYTWDKIYKDMTVKYENRVFEIGTTNITDSPTAWADKVVEDIYGINRKVLTETTCYFSYIKFAIMNDGEVVGVVGGKSQFHHNNTSDVDFYDLNTEKEKKEAAKFMLENKLAWCKEKIIILKNEKNNNSDYEAKKNEEKLQEDYNLFG